MKNFRLYGQPPYSVVVVHGGPGAPGEMKPVAQALSQWIGVVEPIQTADSIQGQIEELKQTIVENATTPIYLIGWSWGAWLSYLLTVQHPDLVKKLILLSSGPFEAQYAEGIMETRLARLSLSERKRAQETLRQLQEGTADDESFNEFGVLMDKTDSYNSLPSLDDADANSFPPQSKIYEKVWAEASALRESGELLEKGKSISCPVVAIHGDYDPHPADGVKVPLSTILPDFQFHLLKQCGHHPWLEKNAQAEFYSFLKKEINI